MILWEVLCNARPTNTSAVDFISTLGENFNLAVGGAIKDTFDGLAVRANLVLDGCVRGDQVREVGSSVNHWSAFTFPLFATTLNSPTAPAHRHRAVVASSVATAVRSVLVIGSVLTEDTDELLVATKGQSTILVLQQDSTLRSDLTNVITVVVLNINMIVDLFIALLSNVVTVSESSCSPRRKVGGIFDLVALSVDEVPRCDDTDSHVIDSVLRNGAIQYGDGEVGTPEGSSAVEANVSRHGHVKACKST